MAKPTASMVLPTPGGPRKQTLAFCWTKPRGGQVADLAGVQLRLEGEVEAVQALVVRQPRQLERVAEPAALAHADLFFQHQVEEVQVAHGLLFDVHPCPRPVQPSLLAQGAWSRVDDLAGRSLCSDELAALNQRPSRQERPGGQS
jgi:hypothetical protein